MDLSLILIAASIFYIAYMGVGMVADARKNQGPFPVTRKEESRRVMRLSKGLGAKLPFNQVFLRNKNYRDKMELLLLRSGHIFGWTAEDLILFKEISIGIAALFLWQMEVTEFLYWGIGLYAGFIAPDFYLKTKITTRKVMIQRQLPGLVDLLALTMESGLDLLAAINRILEKMKPGPLRDELYLLIQENNLGTPRKEALQRLAYRVDLSDIQSLTSIIIQSEELGTSLAQVLRAYAEDMRSRRILLAEEAAGKAPVKLLFPMMVFFFPIVFVVIFGPLALNFMSGYK